MVWERSISSWLSSHHMHRKKPGVERHGKRQAWEARATTPPTSTSSPQQTTATTDDVHSSPPQSPRVSVLSGELGDSEDSTVGSRSSRSRRSPPRRKCTRIKRRSVKLTPKTELPERLSKTGLDGSLPSEAKFEVHMRRGRVHADMAQNMDEHILLSTDTHEVSAQDSTDSDVYDTELDDKFASPPLLAMDLSGRSRYLHVCKRLRVTPCSIFMRHAEEETLNLSYYGLGTPDIRVLSFAFMDNTFITHLDLSFNEIGAQSVVFLAKALKENQHISTIELSYCFLGKEPLGAMAVCQMVESSKNIHHLNISHNRFTGKDYVWFARCLQADSRLFSLNLNDNDLGSVGVAVFAEALADNLILEELNLSWNPLQTIGASAVLQSVSKNMMLKRLNLTHTGLDSRTAAQLVPPLLTSNVVLRALDLRSNHLQEEEVRRITKFLGKTECHVEVKL